MCNLGNSMARNMKIRPGRNPYGLVLVQSAQHLQKNVIPSLWQSSTVTLQMWWMSNLGNAMARNMKSRPGRNTYELVLVQSAQSLQKNDSYAFNSERNLFSTSSQWPLAYVLLLLAIFWCHLVNFPSEKSILPYFSSPRGVATLDCEFHSQAGSTNPAPIQRSTPILPPVAQHVFDWGNLNGTD